MSTSLLYHGFGLRGYRYRRTVYINGHVYFSVEMNCDQICCSVCNFRQVVRRGKVERRFRSLPIGNKTAWIILAIQRVWCSACNLVRQVRLPNILYGDMAYDPDIGTEPLWGVLCKRYK